MKKIRKTHEKDVPYSESDIAFTSLSLDKRVTFTSVMYFYVELVPIPGSCCPKKRFQSANIEVQRREKDTF